MTATVPAVTVPPEIARELKAAARVKRRTSKADAEAMAARDAVVLRAVAAGGSLREVGALAGVSQEMVRLIVNRAKGDGT